MSPWLRNAQLCLTTIPLATLVLAAQWEQIAEHGWWCVRFFFFFFFSG